MAKIKKDPIKELNFSIRYRSPETQIIDVQPICSDASCPAVKPDGHMRPFYNDRDLPYPVGIFQHGFHLFGISFNIKILNILAEFSKGFPSSRGVGSSIFSENQYLIRHGTPPSIKLIYKVARQYCIKIQAIAIAFPDNN